MVEPGVLLILLILLAKTEIGGGGGGSEVFAPPPGSSCRPPADFSFSREIPPRRARRARRNRVLDRDFAPPSFGGSQEGDS